MTDTNQVSLEAYRLSLRPYQVHILQDTAGGEVCWIALHPELPGCHAQGTTLSEAQNLLATLLPEFIQALLDDGLDVPPPDTQCREAIMRPL